MARSSKRRKQAVEASPAAVDRPARFGGLWVCAALFALIVFVFGATTQYDFVNLDDPVYVRDNPYVLMGLTATSVKWAFTTGTAGNWHPLTWLSHMLDVELSGTDPGGHHAVNVAIHALNTLALFGLLWRMTGFMGRSAFVAALFAVHPLHVESVAWISERKDVLSTLFWMATVGTYLAFVRSGRPRHLAAACTFFILGLMAKPMLVSLPLLLLLLDVWPLRRLTLSPLDLTTARRLVWEKTPFIATAAAISVVALYTQSAVGTAASLHRLPVGDRLTHALIAYATYVRQMLVPTNLSAFYPYPTSAPSLWWVLAIGLTMTAASVGAVYAIRRAPYLFTGWFWFVITMLPVIGLVQIGNQSTADRYTYLSLVGLFIILAWGASDLLSRYPGTRPVLLVISVAIVLACALVARQQVQAWTDSETLWRDALASDPDNYYAHGALGAALADKGDLASAVEHLAEAERLKPGQSEVELDWGEALARQGKVTEATTHFEEAVRLDPGFPEAHHNLGVALAQQGLAERSIEEFQAAIRLNPELVKSHHSLAIALAKRGSFPEANSAFQEAMRLAPNSADIRCDFAVLLRQEGKTAEAIQQLQAVVVAEPGHERARAMLTALTKR